MDDEGGALVGLKLGRKTHVVKKRIKPAKPCRSPIISGALVRRLGRIYFGLQNGEVAIFDADKAEFVATIAQPKGRFEITHMVVDEQQQGMWMAFRREANNVPNWCFQEYFTLPDLVGVPNSFTG